MYEKMEITVNGVTPLMMHNGQLADPLNEYAKGVKVISAKRNKTESQFAEMGKLEWYGGLYLNDNRRVVIPGQNIEAALIAAAKKNKLGKQFTAGMLSDGAWPLIYDGPKDVDKLWADGRFVDRRRVCISQSSVMRCRPIFKTWSLSFTVHYLPDMLNPQQVTEAVVICGRVIGLCDYVPKFGRFEIEK